MELLSYSIILLISSISIILLFKLIPYLSQYLLELKLLEYLRILLLSLFVSSTTIIAYDNNIAYFLLALSTYSSLFPSLIRLYLIYRMYRVSQKGDNSQELVQNYYQYIYVIVRLSLLFSLGKVYYSITSNTQIRYSNQILYYFYSNTIVYKYLLSFEARRLANYGIFQNTRTYIIFPKHSQSLTLKLYSIYILP